MIRAWWSYWAYRRRVIRRREARERICDRRQRPVLREMPMTFSEWRGWPH